MKSKRITLPSLSLPKGASHNIPMPIINAYAIEYWDLIINGVSGYYQWIDIGDRYIQIKAIDFDLDTDENYELIIHYHGIRDYEALFPFVADNKLRIRMAHFYEDAEKCFEASAWLPFLLMCGGLFEGILISQSITDSNFSAQIRNAKASNIITHNDELIMTKVREGRNIVHASKNTEEYIKRKDAMDIRKVLDKLIDKFC